MFFDSDKFSVEAAGEEKLRKLISQFSQQTDTFLLEIYAFTDSIASAEYNHKLAKKRFNSIVAYIKQNSAAKFEIIERVRGEAEPASSNATEEGRAKNRRVDIYYFKMNSGRVTLKGKGGMEMSVAKDYFEPDGICECDIKLTEIFTDQQAMVAGIDMTTADGCTLTTAGMIRMEFRRRRRPAAAQVGLVDSSLCAEMVIRIPAAVYDEQMQLWNSTPSGTRQGMSSWSRAGAGQVEYDEKAKMYNIIAPYCPGNLINLDKPLTCSDSSGVVAVPELIRPVKTRYARAFRSVVLSKEGKKVVTMAKFRYNGSGSVFFADSGMRKDSRIGYFYFGVLDGFEMECDSARCSRLKECWCYELPLSAYRRIIYFQKKEIRLKVPRKFRNYAVRLFIPAADTIIPVTYVKGSKRKYAFQQPLPETYVVLYKEGSNAANKRAYDYQVDLEKIHKKFSKRKKVYRAKIKRKQLRHAV